MQAGYPLPVSLLLHDRVILVVFTFEIANTVLKGI